MKILKFNFMGVFFLFFFYHWGRRDRDRIVVKLITSYFFQEQFHELIQSNLS